MSQSSQATDSTDPTDSPPSRPSNFRSPMDDFLSDLSDQRFASLNFFPSSSSRDPLPLSLFLSEPEGNSSNSNSQPSHPSLRSSNSGAYSSLNVSDQSRTLLSSTNSRNVPSLVNSSSHPSGLYTLSTKSISTFYASDVRGMPILEEVEGALSSDPSDLPVERTDFQCPFWFIDCIATFTSRDLWIDHSLDHFAGHEPPSENLCCFCDVSFSDPDGVYSWTQRMKHIDQAHYEFGQNLSTARPDFALFKYLWEKKLMTDKVYKKLCYTQSEAPDFIERDLRVQAEIEAEMAAEREHRIENMARDSGEYVIVSDRDNRDRIRRQIDRERFARFNY